MQDSGIKLYDYITGSNLDSATRVLKQHISNVKEHAIISIERINKDKKVDHVLNKHKLRSEKNGKRKKSGIF